MNLKNVGQALCLITYVYAWYLCTEFYLLKYLTSKIFWQVAINKLQLKKNLILNVTNFHSIHR